MKQVLHIFAKDVRHLWSEIFLTIAIMAGFAWAFYVHLPEVLGVDPLRHASANGLAYAPGSLNWLPLLFTGLVPISWWLLITNLIHDERLVGDHQFWLTRPYEWKKLLAAKILFLLVFLFLPLLIAQCFILFVAGFSPLSYLPGLLFNLMLISGVIVLPLVALATLTSNFARMTLTILGVLLSIGALLALASRVNLEGMNLPWEMSAYFALLIFLFAAAVVWQFATRNTRASVLLLIAFPVLFFVIGLFIAPSQVLVNHSYPLSPTTSNAPAQFSYSPSGSNQPVTFVGRLPGDVSIQIPLDVSGITDRFVVIPDAVRATFEAPGGLRWDSQWQLIFVTKLTPADKITQVGVAMPLAVYDQLKSQTLTVHLSLALTQASEGGITRVSLPEGSFSVPDFGVCAPQPEFGNPDEIIGISCLSALREPPLTEIQLGAGIMSSSCNAPQSDASLAECSWQGSLDAWPAKFGISPVKFGFGASPLQNRPTGRITNILRLYPGAPITFTRYRLARRAQVAITIPGFQLPSLTQGQRNVITNQ